MARSTDADPELSTQSSNPDGKFTATHLDDPAAQLAGRGIQPPELISRMTREERDRLEVHLRRKIDYRLLPMVILMYIMNYLDRNNIAAARIAGPNGKGLQDELKLTSTQYQVAKILGMINRGTILTSGRLVLVFSLWDIF
jgi:hypothetical protein